MSAKRSKRESPPAAGRSSHAGTSRWQTGAAVVVILVVYVLLRIPGIDVPLDRDEGAFGYMGQVIRGGGLPYVDAVDHKPPVAFYINALALSFVPPTARGIHLFLLGYNLVTLLAVLLLANIHFRSLPAGLWCGFAYAVLSASPSIQGFTASTEMWMLLPITLSLLLAVLARDGAGPLLYHLSGFAGAAACWTKPTAFTSVFFVFLFAGATALRGGGPASGAGRALRTLAVWTLGAATFSAIPILYFYVQGAGSEFLYWSLLHNLAYAGRSSPGLLAGSLPERLKEILRGDFLLLGAGVAVAAVNLRRRPAEGRFILGFLALSFLGTLPGFAYRHYFAQVAPAGAIAGGYACFRVLQRVRARRRWPAAVVSGLVIVSVPVAINRHYFLESNANRISRHYFGDNPFPESRPLAEMVAKSTAPDDPVFILGSEPQILFYAERRNATSFVMIYPLLASYPRYREFQETVWAELHRRPPKMILVMRNLPTSYLWDGKADRGIMDRLVRWLQENYAVQRVLFITGDEGEWAEGSDDARLKQPGSSILVCSRK